MRQEQREAVVDLLLLGMFADAPLRVSEDQKLLSVIEEIGWESYQAPDLYLQSAIAKARDATDTLRQRALDYLTQFLGVDGAVDAEETKFLDLAKAALKTG